jgi:hypothetical protein
MQFACPSWRPKLAVDDGGNDAQQRRIRLDDRCGFGGLDRPRGGIFESWLIFYETLHRASVVAVGKIPNVAMARLGRRCSWCGGERGQDGGGDRLLAKCQGGYSMNTPPNCAKLADDGIDVRRFRNSRFAAPAPSGVIHRSAR